MSDCNCHPTCLQLPSEWLRGRSRAGGKGCFEQGVYEHMQQPAAGCGQLTATGTGIITRMCM